VSHQPLLRFLSVCIQRRSGLAQWGLTEVRAGTKLAKLHCRFCGLHPPLRHHEVAPKVNRPLTADVYTVLIFQFITHSPLLVSEVREITPSCFNCRIFFQLLQCSTRLFRQFRGRKIETKILNALRTKFNVTIIIFPCSKGFAGLFFVFQHSIVLPFIVYIIYFCPFYRCSIIISL